MQHKREAVGMRMRDQLIVIIAVAVATMAVAANVFAQIRAADQRIEMEQEGLDAAWSYPVMEATLSTTSAAPANDVDAPTPRSADGGYDDPMPPAETSAPSDDAPAPCSDEEACTIEEVLDREFRNHGQMVAAYVHALGFEEGLDGPRGSYVRQIAKPDIDSDGPPRSDRAAENQSEKDKDTPPGQDKDKDTPPGQDKDKDRDDKDD